MQVTRKINDVRKQVAALREDEAGIALIPTMGFLHDGHLSLLHEAQKRHDRVVVSIFVNPLQFGPKEDFAQYPRDEERDLQLLKQAGADIVFMPDVQEMYPSEILTTVSVTAITDRLCGASRPGHFDGVATVVTKLLNIIQPDRAYFSIKDAQQVAVVSKLCEDLNLPTTIVACPIIRERDGLAMSSRNVRLSIAEREQASVLHRALKTAQSHAHQMTVAQLIEEISHTLRESPLAIVDYIEILTYPDLQFIPEQTQIRHALQEQRLIIALAVFFGQTRLIDNVMIERS